MAISFGIIIGLLIALILIVSNKKYGMEEKFERKIDKIINSPPVQKGMVIELESALDQVQEKINNENENK